MATASQVQQNQGRHRKRGPRPKGLPWSTSGMKHPLCSTWGKMISRCENPQDRQFRIYGARGISVCERWHTFDLFLSDMGEKPSRAHGLDRFPDNDGNYEPGNVRWAIPVQQARNTRTNRVLEYNSQRKCVSEWSEMIGIKVSAIFMRLSKGWSVERALSTPVREWIPASQTTEEQRRLKVRDYANRFYRNKVAAGLCPTCGEPSVKGVRECEFHRAKSNEKRRRLANAIRTRVRARG